MTETDIRHYNEDTMSYLRKDRNMKKTIITRLQLLNGLRAARKQLNVYYRCSICTVAMHEPVKGCKGGRKACRFIM